MSPHVCQPNAVELCSGRMGGEAARARRYNYGAKALREVDSEGHQEHGGNSVKNAGIQTQSRLKVSPKTRGSL